MKLYFNTFELEGSYLTTNHNVQLDFDPLGQTPQRAAYLEVGMGVPVLMLHGFLGSKACWLALMEQLQPDCHCLSLNLLGFGESSKPEIRYDVAIEVAFVRHVVEQLPLKPCYILGHSFGGQVAAAYALQYPTDVSGLLVAAPVGIRDDSFCGRYNHLRPLLWQTPVVDWVLQLARLGTKITGNRELIDKIIWFREELKAQPAALSFLVDRIRPEDAVDTVEKEIHQLKIPTLVISGDRDETIPLWHSQTYASEIPGAELSIIPQATHSLPQDYSDELASLISQFLQCSQSSIL